MTDRDVMKMALDALDKLSKLGNGDSDGNSDGNVIAQEAREKLRSALAQPEPQGSKSASVLVSVIRAFLNGNPPSMARSDAQWALTELEADAARYRWLRERLHVRFQKSLAGDSRLALDVRIGAAYLDATPSGPNSYLNPQTFWDECANLDAAIDAHRSK